MKKIELLAGLLPRNHILKDCHFVRSVDWHELMLEVSNNVALLLEDTDHIGVLLDPKHGGSGNPPFDVHLSPVMALSQALFKLPHYLLWSSGHFTVVVGLVKMLFLS